MFKIKFLPATIGDSIWISYGDDPDATHHVLIDGGTKGTRHRIRKELDALPAEQRRLDLMVVSHIDKDHIGGILTLLQDETVKFGVEDFWFNALRHLPNRDDQVLSIDQGEQLTAELVRQQIAWNVAFGESGEKAVVIPESGGLPKFILPGGMEITLLSPTLEALADLRAVWEDEISEAGLGLGMEMPDEVEEDEFNDDELLSAPELPDVEALAAERFTDDRSEANGSSIAFLAEFEGKRVLFAADAHVDKLLESLELISPGERLKLDLFKISHHGSRSTTSQGLIAKLDCPRYVFSTNGSIFKHPHHEAVSRVIVEGGEKPQLFFNYQGKRNKIWGSRTLQDEHDYTTTYPEADDLGIEIDL